MFFNITKYNERIKKDLAELIEDNEIEMENIMN